MKPTRLPLDAIHSMKRTFDPWVGKRYGDLDGLRVLILGESHYGTAGTETRSTTLDVVRTWGTIRRSAFFTKTLQLVLGLDAGWVSDEVRADFWDRVAFCNYVQTFCGDSARRRPTLEQWQQASGPFIETLMQLQPDVLVVLGKDLSGWLPEIPAHIITCRPINHPSSNGFSVTKWHPVVAEGLAAARSRKLSAGVASRQARPLR